MLFPSDIPLLPEDPILGLFETFSKDPRSQKVNLGIGIYLTSDGLPLVLNCVKNAEHHILQKHLNKVYLPIEGDPEYIRLVSRLIFGDEFIKHNSNRLFCAQSLGGSGALRIAGEFLAKVITKSIFVSQPAWPNYKQIFDRSGLTIGSYPYLSSDKKSIDFSSLCTALNELPPLSVVVLQCCGHNPTGFDLTLDQWKELSALAKKKRLIPFFDVAYHGFADSLAKDIQPVQYFAQQEHDMIVTYSFSKNMGLYGERVGFLAILSHGKDLSQKISSQVKSLIRGNYSNPPLHGERIMRTILESPELTFEWDTELKNMRDRVDEMRHAFVAALMVKGHDHKFSYMLNQKGLFGLLDLSPQQVQRLRDEKAVYLTQNGRVNIAGINTQNVDYVAESIASVM